MQNFRLPTAQMKFNKICTLIGFFYWKYIKFQQKNDRGVKTLKTDAKYEEKPICWFTNNKNLVNFDQSTQRSKKFTLWLIPFGQSI